MHGFFHCAEKRGYSGVGIYAARTGPGRRRPWKPEFDAEGRYIQADFGNLSVVSLYLPSGSSSDERLQAKYRFMDRFLPHMAELQACGREVIVCGDWNIAHREIDLKNWKSNQKNSGFLPEERAWLSRLFDEQGWMDVPPPASRGHRGLPHGGRTVARRGPRTSAGDWTPDRHGRHRRHLPPPPPSTRTRASATTRR